MELEHIAVVFMDYIFRFRCPYTSSDRFLHHSTQCLGLPLAVLYCLLSYTVSLPVWMSPQGMMERVQQHVLPRQCEERLEQGVVS